MSEQVNKRSGKLRGLMIFSAAFFALAAIMYWVVAADWSRTVTVNSAAARAKVLPELTQGQEIRQDFRMGAEKLTAVNLDISVWNAREDEKVDLRVIDSKGIELYTASVPVSAFELDDLTHIPLTATEAGKAEKDQTGEVLTLVLTADGGLSFWATKSGQPENAAILPKTLTLGGQEEKGVLRMSTEEMRHLMAARLFWPCAVVLWALLTAAVAWVWRDMERPKPGRIATIVLELRHFRYLLKTLVVRDFKVKYRASVFGVFWSFLNPFLMMLVYNFVFAGLFHRNTDHYLTYLMCAIVTMNYFRESTNLGMRSIVGNAKLIKKVYVPKILYPLSKVLSSAINLAISMVPLALTMLINGVAFRKSLLLLPFALITLMLFCLGVGMFLSALSVFFRDIQFLWSIILMLWTYLTPIFYMETIIPAQYQTIYHMNPLYQYIFFLRSIVINGVSPTPVSYAYCILASVLALGLGYLVFRKTQDRFVLHL